MTYQDVQTSLMTSYIRAEGFVKHWPVQDAKARFSELLRAALTEGPQIVSLRGIEAAVLVPMQQWRSLQQRARPSLKELLLAQERRVDLGVPVRGRLRRRKPHAAK